MIPDTYVRQRRLLQLSSQDLVAQGRTIAKTMEIAQDAARKRIESCFEHGDPLPDEMIPATRMVRKCAYCKRNDQYTEEGGIWRILSLRPNKELSVQI